MKKKINPWFPVGFLLGIVGSGVGLFVYPLFSSVSFHEMNNILATKDVATQAKAYAALIKRIGPVEAQEALLRSGLPFDGQTHLLNHTVGDYLYKTHGAKGLTYCKDYFLSSCYHGFVLQAIAGGGQKELITIMQECKKAGMAVFPQCAHAIGHGLLAWHGYANLPRALEACDSIRNRLEDFPLFNCHDGVFMENIWAVHEGKPSPERWVRESDPFYPCSEPQIPERYKNACWANQPSLMYQLFGGDIPRIALACYDVQSEEHQRTCFDALARQIHPLIGGDIEEAAAKCALLPDHWSNDCMISIGKAAFSMGDSALPVAICQRLGGVYQDQCYEMITPLVNVFLAEGQGRDSFCESIPHPRWQEYCASLVLPQ